MVMIVFKINCVSIVYPLAEPISSFSLDEDILVCEQLLASFLPSSPFSSYGNKINAACTETDFL